MIRTVLIDNYDSFTFNLYQLLAQISGIEPIVVTNNQLSWEELSADLAFDNIVISPGPGSPDKPGDFGICADAILKATCPVLGVCLGHQGIGHYFGGRVGHAPTPMHGRRSEIFHDGRDLFANLPSPFPAVRYHSLLVTQLPDVLTATAWTKDGLLMGLRHNVRPIWGVQFHPESICTEYGRELLTNFGNLTRDHLARTGASSNDGKATVGSKTIVALKAPREELRLVAKQVDFYRDSEVAFVTLFADKPGAFWLDSSRHEPGLSRFSYMGDVTGPHAHVLRCWAAEKRLSITRDGKTTTHTGDVLDHIERELSAKTVSVESVPFDFAGGYVGYLGYEFLSAGLPGRPISDIPDAGFVHADRIVVFDHQEKTIWLSCCVPAGEVAEAQAWIDEIEAKLSALPASAPLDPVEQGEPVRLTLRHPPAAYLAMIDRCKTLIRDGESYEMCLTNQLRAATDVDPLRFYRVLRHKNPAPYAAYLSFPDDLVVASSSPELYLSVDRGEICEAKPMKGTARRRLDPVEDERVKQALHDDEKTQAENLMIVDLVRNDLGRVCEIGSVHVPKLMHIESYATVHQMVSTIAGRLRQGCTAIDALRASFPGGSMTGAPKVRTMEMLERLEQGPRGIYSGTIGFLSYSGVTRLNIVIRTAVIRPGLFTVGTGGAIVALSDPDEELDETFIKLEALVGALAEATGNDPKSLVQALWQTRRGPRPQSTIPEAGPPRDAPMTEQEKSPIQSLDELRGAIDRVDADLLSALGHRLSLCAEVAELKKANNIPMMQPARVEQVKSQRAALAPQYGLRPEFVQRLYAMIIDEACHLEDDIIGAEES